MVRHLRQAFGSNTGIRESKGPWQGRQMGLFPYFVGLSCFTEHGHCMVSLTARKRYINYETAAHYANEESSHDLFFKINCNFLLLIQKPLVRSRDET